MTNFKDVFENNPALKGKKFQDLDANTKQTFVGGYVHSKIILREAEKSGVENKPEYKEKLAHIKTQLAQEIYIKDLIKSKITDIEIKAEYAKLKKELAGKEEVKASHILVKDEAAAKDLKAKLDKGADFAELAKQSSTDEGSKASGGELGYFQKGQLVPEFEAVAFSLAKGKVSDPVKTQFGYHIIKVEDKRAIKVPTMEEAKPSIENKLSRDIIEQVITNLDKQANVKIML
jgi:peptidylprolyl isomerase/peptidyl-prolyl cis-trans isomerase C